MSYISFKQVRKEYVMGEVTIKAVDGVDFHIEKGEFAIIVGPSGAGKTTVLNMLGAWTAGPAERSWWTAPRAAASTPHRLPSTPATT